MLRDAGAAMASKLHMAEYQQRLRHELILEGDKGAREKCLEEMLDVQAITDQGCSLQAAANVPVVFRLNHCIGYFWFGQPG